jgi:hypothetical protein
MSRTMPLSRSELITTVSICCFGSASALAFAVLDWFLSAMGAASLLLIVLAVLLVSLIASIIHAWTYRRNLRLAISPWVLNAGLLTLVFSGAVRDAQIRWNFDRNLRAREEIVRMVERGEIQPRTDSQGRSISYGYHVGLSVTFPSEYAGEIDASSDVRVWNLDGAQHVLFVVKRGLFSGIDGFVYRADDLPPVVTPRALHADKFLGVRQFAPHWWWVGYPD